MFDQWCSVNVSGTAQKKYLRYTEKVGGRDAVSATLPATMRSHYDDAARVAEDVADLGFAGAAAILAERLPRTARARSGELGEILATELVEETMGYHVPVRRLRYKDGREMALRGDDFIGICTDEAGELHFAKGESKSRANLSQVTITEARQVLSRDAGRPTPTSVLFIADRLLERGGPEEALGRAIRNDVATKAVPAARIEHVLFTVSGNPAPNALEADLAATSNDRTHTSVHLHIPDHQDFIKESYEKALKLGDG